MPFINYKTWYSLEYTQAHLAKTEESYDLLNKFEDMDIDHDKEEFIDNYMRELYDFEIADGVS